MGFSSTVLMRLRFLWWAKTTKEGKSMKMRCAFSFLFLSYFHFFSPFFLGPFCQELLWIGAFDTSMQPPTCSTSGCARSMPKLVNVQPFGGDTEKWKRIATTYGKELRTLNDFNRSLFQDFNQIQVET